MTSEPIREPLDWVVLAAVRARPGHGYGIAGALRARRDAAAGYPEGLLYPALHRLERVGLLASRWCDLSGRRRRIYRLTAKGRRSLATRDSAAGGWVVSSGLIASLCGSR